MVSAFLPLARLELAAGFVWGEAAGVPELPKLEARVESRSALEDVMVSALAAGPCLVSFSGGRDSSAVLGMAAHVARSEGLPLPIPTTLLFPGRADTEESEWQELVVRHLNLKDWQRHVIEDDRLGVLGNIAQSALRRHGVLWPPNVHLHVPMLADARGGTLLTGIDGDGLFDGWRWRRIASVLCGRARPAPFDILRALHMMTPATIRAPVAMARAPLGLMWLHPPARRAAEWRSAVEDVSEPVCWRRRVRWWARRRWLAVACESLRLLADDAGASIAHPLLDARFLAAVAADGGRAGFRSRKEALVRLVGDLLPAELLGRPDKATFDSVFWGSASREFRTSWTGDGVPDDLVDTDQLQTEWAKEEPSTLTAPLLQAAWLATSEVNPGHQEIHNR